MTIGPHRKYRRPYGISLSPTQMSNFRHSSEIFRPSSWLLPLFLLSFISSLSLCSLLRSFKEFERMQADFVMNVRNNVISN
jgi:hypothetical protein